MKSSVVKTIVLLLFTLCGTASACGQQVHIRGTISDYYLSKIQFYTFNNYLEGKPQVLSQDTTDKHGRFVTKIMLPKAQPVMISYGSGYSAKPPSEIEQDILYLLKR